jgi:hypothetical protein
MANVDAPFGLRPVRYMNGSPYQGQANAYFATGATGQIAIGDPVTLTGSTNTTRFGSYDPGFLQQVSLATAGDGNPIVGVCVGVLAVTADSLTYRVTSTDRIIMVADEPNLIFHVQADDDADATDWAGTTSGLFANLASATANTAYGLSQWELDGSDNPDSDYSNQVFLKGLARIPGNEIGPFAVWEVMINLHQYTTGAISDAGRFEAI